MHFSDFFRFFFSAARSSLLLSSAYTHGLLPRVSKLNFYKIIGVTSLLLHSMVVWSHYKIERGASPGILVLCRVAIFYPIELQLDDKPHTPTCRGVTL